jgi:hypothetical protein
MPESAFTEPCAYDPSSSAVAFSQKCSLHPFPSCFCFCSLRPCTAIELRLLHMLGKCSTTRATSPALLFCILFLRQGINTFSPRLALNSQSSCL